MWNYAVAMVAAPFGDLEPDVIWTLRHEFIFYILFAATFLTKPLLLCWLLVIWFLLPLFASAAGYTAGGEQSILNETISTFVHPANLEFGAGFLVGIIWLRRSNRWSIRAPALGIFCIAFFLVVWAVTFVWLNEMAAVWRSAILATSFLPLVVVCAHATDARISRVLVLLGNASFSIYLFHLHALSFMLTVLS